jgi:hypothetical protein
MSWRAVFWVLLLCVSAVLVIAYGTDRSAPASSTQPSSIPAPPARPSWVYDEQTDKMGRGTVRHASIESTNLVSFGWPYHGAQRARLHLRIHPTWGSDVILALTKAHFLCRLDGCEVTVRFDDGKPQTYRAGEPADHSIDTIFIKDYNRFVSQLKRAKTVRIEAQFYQEGTRVFEFNAAGLTLTGPTPSRRNKAGPKATSPDIAVTIP